MQRRLISFAPKPFCAGLPGLHTLVRRQTLFKVCRSSPGSSRFAHHPPPVYVFNLSKGICSFPSVSHKNNLLHNNFPRLSQRRCCSNEPDMAEQRFIVEYAKRGTAGCKKCKDKIQKEVVRIGKVVPNPFSESAGEMKEWYHVKCIFEKLERARATTKKIEDITDLDGWEELQDEDKEIINKHVSDLMAKVNSTPKKKTPVKQNAAAKLMAPPADPSLNAPRKFSGFTATKAGPSGSPGPSSSSPPTASQGSALSTQLCDPQHKDCLFREFRKLCATVAEHNSYNVKTQIIEKYLKKGSCGDKFHGDLYLTVKLLLPGVVKSVYNLNDKQIVKLFARIFRSNQDDMVRDLEQGDVSETVRMFFDESKSFPPSTKSLLTLQEVDASLTRLAQLTKEDEQQTELEEIAKKCTSNDLKCIIRLIKHDLKMNSGAKHVLDAVDPNAYDAFKASRNLGDVIERVLRNTQDATNSSGPRKLLTVEASLMTPVQPMLAEACKSVEYAMKKCPNGMFSEIKYDGERVQVHKNGDVFSYFSRSLKPVLPHKVAHFKEYIPLAFPGGHSMILDAEVLLIDTNTSKPLPFGTLGVHKKAAFQDAKVCLFVFDCIYFNGVSLMERPLRERRKFLVENMEEVPNRILFSEMKHVTRAGDLADMITRVIREGLEGLVLKDVKGAYEPGKRHWLKVKKDYLNEGAMADTADLVVLGGFYGKGSNGGIMSSFLMGCYDPDSKKWCTVTKCSGGYDDAMLARLQKELDVIKISKEPSKIPGWIKVIKNYYPDFIIRDPQRAPVWEITGAEFSKSEMHTADGISIRFPRMTRVRDDKDWKTATNLHQLKELFRISKENCDFKVTAGPSSEDKGSSGGDSGGSSPSPSSRGGKAPPPAPRAAPRAAPAPKRPSTSTTPKLKAVKSEPRSPPIEAPAAKKVKKTEDVHSNGQSKTKSTSQLLQPRNDKTLLDIFSGVKLFLPVSVQDFHKLRRYFVAYDGDVVEDFDSASATHTMAEPEEDSPAQRVTPSWIWDCIRKRRVLPPC
ncbi:DNA ligase 3 [Platichthys flesus]|uniref:DNA ligase 3 n=1 Tax=Platichthys flesus TaxID=8260 RepID=UPI002DBD9B28|nr:DNA ligase 3 [Platichthys flesus]